MPPLPGDPGRIGSYRIAGRLGRGGQGTVYLAESPSGTRVALKVLGRGDASDRTLVRSGREIELARRVKPFCTARVLEHGEVGGMPYIVSEYVDGPSLAQVIEERGPLRGAELRRLAIGTLTALAAIHQAGVVHRDFKPANVLLAREGPRVIDFGISRALDGTATVSEGLVGTPPYMAPEQFDGREAGPAADLFSWASTVVCAATGKPPFGDDALPAVIHRILNGEPRLGDLDDELRDLVGECLAKDPRARPAATAALLRLLGHPVEPRRLLDEGREQAVTPPSPPPPRPARRARPVIAVLVALALAATAGVAVLAARAGERSGTGRSPTPGVSGASGDAAGAAGGTMPTNSTTSVRVPGTKVVLRENPADTERVTTYQDQRGDSGGTPTYLRRGAGADFTFLGTFMTAVAAPGGARVAVNPDNKFELGEFDLVRVVDPAGGAEVRIRTVDTPLKTFDPHWDRQGRRILLTIYDRMEEPRHTRGFVIVDAVSRTARISRVPGDGADSPYVWGPDATSVMHAGPDGSVLFHRLDGTLLRTLPKVGEVTRESVRNTSLGKVLVTECPAKADGMCVWDAVTAARRATVPIPKGTRYGGWVGDRHFLATVPGKKTTKVVMLDLRGRTVRVLADGPAAELAKISLWYSPV